jgi:hypothetical protein
MKYLVGSALALALAAGAANAAEVTVSGAVNVPTFGSTGPLAIGSTVQNDIALTTNGNASVVGVVRASSTSGSLTQVLELTLTSFTFTAAAAGQYSLTVNIAQDYVIDPNAISATGSHQLNGNVDFSGLGQFAQVSSSSVHEATNLPDITTGVIASTGAGTQGFNVGQGPTTAVALVGNIYRIATTYTFSIAFTTPGSVSIDLPDSGVDNATLTIIPLPPAAFAGLGGLAFVGLGATLRRRGLNKA